MSARFITVDKERDKVREYEVEVVERKIVYVEATNETEAIHAACCEAISIEPEEINCSILSVGEDDDE